MNAWSTNSGIPAQILRRVALALALLLSLPAAANAACAWTNLTNGQPANADQVMGNFNCKAPLDNPLFNGRVGINTPAPLGKLDVVQGNGTGVSWGSAFNVYDGSYKFSLIQDASYTRFRNEGGGGYHFFSEIASNTVFSIT